MRRNDEAMTWQARPAPVPEVVVALQLLRQVQVRLHQQILAERAHQPGTHGYPSPRHQTHFEPSILELNGML